MTEKYVSKKRRARRAPVIRPASELSKPELMWVTSGYHVGTGSSMGSMLHAPALNEYETDMLARQGMYFGGDVLCGAAIDELNLPGPKTAKIAQRCARCCKEVGYPSGVGSPIHDAEIRIMIGLDEPVVPPEWAEMAERYAAIRALCSEWIVRGQENMADDYEIGRGDMAEAIIKALDGVSQEETLAAS